MEGSEYVFPSPRMKMLSDMSISAVLKRMKITSITVHGFRSTFRDWAAESTAYPSDVVEMALAQLSERNVVELDPERRAHMVSNLLVVLCGERGTQPIVNAGSIY